MAKPKVREKVPPETKLALLTECGYRCANPTCRMILALDMHHIWEVSEGGSDDLSNLIALCPSCHALYHRGTIKQESVYAWKSILVAINRGFDHDALDKLLLVKKATPEKPLMLSGDGVLLFARLIAADLVEYTVLSQPTIHVLHLSYFVTLTSKGKLFVDAWEKGDRSIYEKLIPPLPPEAKPPA